jgi:transcriptional regulator GlxA family with amidase domain
MPKGIAGYVKTMRLKKAKELLENGELSVQAVAMAVGYGDYNYFCKDFKRNFGISAKEYRIGCNIK